MTAHVVFWSWLDVVSLTAAARTSSWVARRISLWRQTALHSILRQTSDAWSYVLFVRPEGSHLTAALAQEFLDHPHVSVVAALPRRGHMAGPGVDAWRRSLPVAERYLCTRIDSDDRYHPAAAKVLARYAGMATRERPFLQFNRGYAHTLGTRSVYAWTQKSSPFYARVYGREFRRPSGPWETPPHHKLRPHSHELPGGHFMVTLHPSNTSTSRRNAGEEIPRSAAASVLAAFGVAWHNLPPARAAPSRSRVFIRRPSGRMHRLTVTTSPGAAAPDLGVPLRNAPRRFTTRVLSTPPEATSAVAAIHVGSPRLHTSSRRRRITTPVRPDAAYVPARARPSLRAARSFPPGIPSDFLSSPGPVAAKATPFMRNYPKKISVHAPRTEAVEWARKISARRIAEIGIYRGMTSRLFRGTLPPDGTLDLFDFQDNVRAVATALAGPGPVVRAHGNSDRYLDSYCWSLMRLLERHASPLWDFVYLDGAHTWAVDGFAALLVDELLEPGGDIFLDDFHWTLAASPSLNPKAFPLTARCYSAEQIQTPQVQKVAMLLERRGYTCVLPTKVWRKPGPDAAP